MTPISSIICPCEHTPTEALKRHAKNILYLVITTYKSLNRLST